MQTQGKQHDLLLPAGPGLQLRPRCQPRLQVSWVASCSSSGLRVKCPVRPGDGRSLPAAFRDFVLQSCCHRENLITFKLKGL